MINVCALESLFSVFCFQFPPKTRADFPALSEIGHNTRGKKEKEKKRKEKKRRQPRKVKN